MKRGSKPKKKKKIDVFDMNAYCIQQEEEMLQKESEYDFFKTPDGQVHDKDCCCLSEIQEKTGCKKITPKSKLHSECQRAALVRSMCADKKHMSKYMAWFDKYHISTSQIKQLFFEQKARCTLQNNKMFIDTSQEDRWHIDTTLSGNQSKGILFHCNYYRTERGFDFNSSAYHKQFEKAKSIPFLISRITTHKRMPAEQNNLQKLTVN